ncbi:hypothetical protein D3C72_2098990 [compost metagenome]
MNLRTTSKELYDAIDLRKTHHFIIRDIGHSSIAIDRQKVMLTERKALNFLHNDHLVVVHRIVDHGDLREVVGIETFKDLVHIHFC